MKAGLQRWLARVALSLVAIAGWGTVATAQSLSGKYGGDECPYELTFRGKDVVYITTLGMSEVPGHYKVDGDKVVVTASGWPGAVFTRKGNALETAFMGETLQCTKVSGAGARPQAAQPPAAAPRMSSADRAATDFIRAAIDSHWVKGPDGWTTQPQDSNPFYTQFQELTFTIKPEQVSQAQRLNGADYRGTVTFKGTPERSYRTSPQGWSDWEDGEPGMLGVERRNGAWRMWGLAGSPDVLLLSVETDLFKGLKPDPARVPTGHDTLRTATPAEAAPAQGAPEETAPLEATRREAVGVITVNADPSATVFIDGDEVGATPVLIQTKAGRHTIRVELAGYKTQTETVQVDASSTIRRQYTLIPGGGEIADSTPPSPVSEAASGFITVNVIGTFGEVYIDNVDVGQTPLINYKVKAGRHSIRVERVGYKTVTETVQVDPNAMVRKSYPLTRR